MKKIHLLTIYLLFITSSLFAQMNITVFVQVIGTNGVLLDSVPVTLTADVCTPIGHASSGITLPGIGYQDNFVANCSQGIITSTITCPNGNVQTASAYYTPVDTILTITITCNTSPPCNAYFSYDSIGFYPSVITNPYYFWDFGNGTSSNQVTPANNLSSGVYNVCLYTETPTGDSCNYCQNVFVGNASIYTVTVNLWTYDNNGQPATNVPFQLNANTCLNNLPYNHSGTINGFLTHQFQAACQTPGSLIINTSTCGNPSQITYAFDSINHTINDTLICTSTVPCTGNFAATQVQGFTYSFQPNPSGTGPFSHYWDFGDGNTATTASSTTHTYSNSGVYSIFLTTTDANNLTCTYFDSLLVSNPSSCTDYIQTTISGNTVSFGLPNGGNAGTYAWDFGDGNTSTSAVPTHTYASPGTYFISVVYSTFNGAVCTYTTWITTGTITGGCIDTSLIDFSVVCPTIITPVCGCDSVTYDNDCIAENYFGISSWTQGACSNTPNPSCQITAGFQYYMTPDSNGTTITFFGNSTPNASSYSWSFGDSTTGTGQTVTHYYSAPNGPTTQAYTICMTATLTPVCADTYCETLVIVVNPFGTAGGGIYEGVNFTGPGDPMPNITIHLESPAGIILQTDLTDQDGLYSFNQLPFGHYVLKIDEPTINHLGEAILLTPVHSVVDSLNFIVDSDGSVNTGVEDQIGVEYFELIPNPAGNEVYLQLSVASELRAEIELMSLIGQQLHQEQVSLPLGNHAIRLDLESISRGVYFVVIRTAEGQISKRLVRL